MKFKMHRAMAAAAFGWAVMVSSNALAQQNQQLLETLLGNESISQEQFDDLMNKGADEEDILKVLRENSQISQEQYETLSRAAEAEGLGDKIEVSLEDGFKVQTRDENFKVQIGGRIMGDGAWYSNDNNTGDDLNDGGELRRARLFIKGTMYKVWEYKFQYDFVSSSPIKDAYLKYKGLKGFIGNPLDITAGNFKEAFSLEELTSSKYITFMERALPVEAFAPSRHLGGQLNAYNTFNDGNAGWTAAFGAFGDSVEADNDDGDEGYGYVGRVTFAPIATKTMLAHFGGAAEYRNLRGQSGRVRSRPESHIANLRLVDTGNFDVDDRITWNIETAGVWGPFSIQGEYFQQRNNATNGTEYLFDGYYAYASWFITGESRAYKVKKGAFARVKPKSVVGKGGYGAFELALRYSALDLNNKDIQGGNEQDWTVGVNWYATSHIRFMFNYINVTSTQYDGGARTYNNPDIYQIRGQIDF